MENRIVVGVADMKISNDTSTYLVTYSLGSCIGVVVYDPAAKVGGMLHYMLPNMSDAGKHSANKPFMFGSTGMPLLLDGIYKLGAKKIRLIVKIAGGANIMDYNDIFKIGKRNTIAARQFFFEKSIKISNESVGGRISRTLFLDMGSGEVTLKSGGRIVSKL